MTRKKSLGFGIYGLEFAGKLIINVFILLVFFSATSISFIACHRQFYAPRHIEIKPVEFTQGKPKNIILMIGDGMGLAQICAGKIKAGTLNLEQIKSIGLMTTYSASDYVTDSAAGATAFACGEKTNNGYLGVDAKKHPLKNITEMVQEKGLSTGIVVTCTITHATPAAFISHQSYRFDEEGIAEDIVDCNVNVLIGGGKNNFIARKDGVNLIDKMQSNGYHFISDAHLLKDSIANKFSSSDKVIALLYDYNPPKMSEGRGDYGQYAVSFALNILSKNEKGFFMMIEGSQIDWGGHANDVNYIMNEVEDFDNTVGIVMDFVNRNPETLLIITADHECGGLALNEGNYKKKTVDAKFTTDMHTGIMVPVFAYGKGAEYFQGFYDNTDLGKKMMELLGIK